MDLIKITDLTNQLRISSRSLRYYEQIGLIRSERPAFEKYRFFDSENIERLKQIMVLRKMQIPVKDIIRIYESKDISVVVKAFVDRINIIDEEMTALSELKRIVNEFLQTMIKSGIKKISALPLLYEEMNKQLEIIEDQKPVNYDKLTEISAKLQKPLDTRILNLPTMQVLSSKYKGSDVSDVTEFWDWLNKHGIPADLPGQHSMFEYQDSTSQTIIIQKVDNDFVNDSPFTDYLFSGGLFAVAGVYADEDMSEFYRSIIRSFDDNLYYEIDYQHDGSLRHETLVETVISSDSQRERVEIFIPVKKRLPDASLYDSNELVHNISVQEIVDSNPVLWDTNVRMDSLKPILDPFYHVNDEGEAEYVAVIDKRQLSTEVEVKIPFRVDIEFRVDEESGRFGYGSDEGSIRFYHGSNLYGINMENNPDNRLSKEAICFNQPVFDNYFCYPKLGKIITNEYNHMTWIVGEKHFAVIINGEVRYCGVNFPYMTTDIHMQQPHPVILGSNGQGKRYFRSVHVSQLKQPPKIKIKEGALKMITKQSNNIITNIHQLITSHYGENYWFNGCAKYVMECLGEPDYDYWFFAGLTGDNLAQVYAYDHFRGDGRTDYMLSDSENSQFIEDIFSKCGYESTFVAEKNLMANRTMYLQTLMAYIDKGIPVIRFHRGWGVFAGYEDYGKTLLYLTGDKTEPERIPFEMVFSHPDGFSEEQAASYGFGWVFVGEKKEKIELKQIYRDVIQNMSRLLTKKTREYCFGAEAFRAWASDIENGKFDGIKPEEFDGWDKYIIYVCNLATNGSCCNGFLEKAQELNPDYVFLEDIRKQYQQTGFLWNNQNGEDLEAIGGGFNVTLDALQNKAKREKIASKIREFAVCIDNIIEILNKNL